MTPKSARNKARALQIAQAFKSLNPGKVPYMVISIWPKRTKMPRKAPNLTVVDLLMIKATRLALRLNRWPVENINRN